MMKACAFLVFTLFAVAGHSQNAADQSPNSLNHYKYVIVPERFSFSKEDDQYSLNSTTKLLLDQKGFVACLGSKSLPAAVAGNRCNALTAEVTQNNGMFVTRLTLLLKDCQGNILFKSKEGKSREKEFPVAYNQALNEAFLSLNDVPYKYDSSAAAAQPATTSAAAPVPAAPAPATLPATAPGDITGTLYAQVTPNGYQLIDTTPKKVLVLYKTSMQDFYIAEAGATNGVVFKKDNGWVFEYYKDSKLVSQKLEIKF